MEGRGSAVLKALRLVIVDDDEWVRRGRAAALEETGHFASIETADHERALDPTFGWDEVDIALVDARDPSFAWDKFAGVAVIRAIRSAGGAGDQRIRTVVVTGHARNDLLRQRCAEAGADYFYSHDDVRTVDALLDALLRPAKPLPPVVRQSNLQAALDLVAAHRAADLFVEGAVQKQSSLSRRKVITVRSKVSKLLGSSTPLPFKRIARVLNDARGEGDSGK